MFSVRRWWERYGYQLVLAMIVLGIALFIRQTQGALIAEMYSQLVQPFQTDPPLEERLQTARVTELETQLVELQQQNAQLKQLLEYAEAQQLPSITAPVIGRSVDHWWKQAILGRGSDHGIKEGDVVTSPGGLVGRVIKVTPHTSRVLLVSDSASRVGAAIARSRFMGFMRGDGSELAVMEFYEKVPDVKEGDQVVTSPVSNLFPPGIPVGKVETVNLEKSPAPEIAVRLTAPIDFLEWVVVHPFESKY
ncbi:MAG: rod shape-determining protein MreC [Spirulinaceae cyanobacterium RM2_2_10]|nr:rod shape-determining protein MreC [Spirulinaceae cyanobacterium SM2_1_0]NJO18908.1 rod shape-determining protein MreC [Spirulinaceae cyanobacterium RM2_2_10]